jgi:hypothetical protein
VGALGKVRYQAGRCSQTELIMTEYVRDESSKQPVGTGRPPAIFLFQPHTFRRGTPARLAEWEQRMLTHFG